MKKEHLLCTLNLHKWMCQEYTISLNNNIYEYIPSKPKYRIYVKTKCKYCKKTLNITSSCKNATINICENILIIEKNKRSSLTVYLPSKL